MRGPIGRPSNDDPNVGSEWVEAYRERFPDGFVSPSIHAFSIY